ncbi:pancreatic triacylglycerol lipase [Strongylocentrotus purpuratus]|uniref:Lipase domain-containing protein n=1 Tax=Strongylocentrotus purpuratus TaxID=7668 RepID=A0A7M7NQR4_STRPU|nr:pancreatic triacylglycerol lipase [Strongylocentrotus purpuratus]
MFSSAALAFVALVSVFGGGRCDITFPNYEQLGVFKVKDLPCNGADPESPDEIGTTFELFNKAIPQGEMLDWTNADSVRSSSFNPSWPTHFLIHGWTDTMAKPIWINLRKALVDRDESRNVICVDWSTGASSKWYPTPRDNTRVVGRIIGKMVEQLVDNKGARFEDMHIIGHSLGAHIAGYAGEALGGRAGRVTGLDPAGPLFGGTDNQCKLDKSDAMFVDVMHTDGDLVVFGGAGLMEECGDHDWYPHGGKDQPGCGMFDAGCDHMMAIEYFTESVLNKKFPATKWAKTVKDLFKNPSDCIGEGDCPEMGFNDHDDSKYRGGDFEMDTSL